MLTKFQRKCYQMLSKVPNGKITTYGDIAKMVGSPKSARAVGQAMKNNKEHNNIHCYKVVCADGSIGDFNVGIKDKISRLKKDGIKIVNNKIVTLEKVRFKLF